MPITETTNWGNVQRRAVDPYSAFTSESLNFLNSIIGRSRARISGLMGEYLYDSPTDRVYIHLTSGLAMKDYVLISFTEDTYVRVGTWPLDTGVYLVVLDYTFETKFPPNIAQISVIPEADYDSASHMALYRLIVEGSDFPGDVTLETIEEIYATISDEESASDILVALQAHIDSVYAHNALYYTKAQIDTMIVEQALSPELLQLLTTRSLLWVLDSDNDVEPEIEGVNATVDNNILWELDDEDEDLIPKETLSAASDGNWILDEDGDICVQGL